MGVDSSESSSYKQTEIQWNQLTWKMVTIVGLSKTDSNYEAGGSAR